MKIGSENKRAICALIVLGAGALYGVYSSLFPAPSASTPSSAATVAVAAPASDSELESGRVAQAAGRGEEFKPKLRDKRLESRGGPNHIDPALRLDLLARLQQVAAASGMRNIFQIGASPAKADKTKHPGSTVAGRRPGDAPRPQAFNPPTPPPARIDVKYYGWVAPSGSVRMKAFLLDGDAIFTALEGDTIKGHYRVVRISPNNVVLEDTNDKLKLTLTKVEDAA